MGQVYKYGAVSQDETDPRAILQKYAGLIRAVEARGVRFHETAPAVPVSKANVFPQGGRSAVPFQDGLDDATGMALRRALHDA